MSEIVGACLSQFHDDENSFELLLAYSDGREVGFSVSRKVAQKMASELANGAGCDPSEIERKAEAVEHRSDCDFKHSPIQLCDCPSTPPAAPVRVPDGWQLVPTNPTQEMLTDIAKACRDFYTENGPYPRAKAVYRAMLSAAPSPIDGRDGLIERSAVADQIIGQIEDRFPNWRSYRDLIDCIDCTLQDLRKEAGHEA